MKIADLEEFLMLVEGEDVGTSDNRERIAVEIRCNMLSEEFHAIIYKNEALKTRG
jgi:hypothetical protein